MNIRQDLTQHGVPLVQLESDWLRVDVAPALGGRVISLVEKTTGYEFLWRNAKLQLVQLPGGSEYDPNFYGGIDELLPNDPPETIDGINCPDHGELWTTALDPAIEDGRLRLSGNLRLFGLTYERVMWLRPDSPRLECAYRVANVSSEPRHFLWKLHAALAVEAGDVIECPARTGQVVDPAWSRFGAIAPFSWPKIDGQAVNLVPPANGSMDFFYLSGLERGQMAWRRPGVGLKFAYEWDLKVFPYAWLFASYGGFLGHYTIILEPCTTMPMSVIDAAKKGHCSRLEPGHTLETRVSLYAGLA